MQARAVRSEVFPEVEAANFGLNASTAQFVTWNGTDSAAVAPSVLVRLPVIASGLQFVGLNVNPGRLIVDVHVLDLQRDPVDDRRDLVRASIHRS